MADYRLSAKIIGRSTGRSSVAAAAYRAGVQLEDDRTGLSHDYTRKRGVLHSEIRVPDGTPDWMQDRAKLWNAVEAAERRKDAQLARELQLSLPHELSFDQNRDLVLSFVQSRFVDQGMIADIAIHAPDRDGDQRNIHAHVMLTMRALTADGFGKKNRDWNTNAQLEQWRKDWADHQNARFRDLGMAQRVDHRSYADQGLDKEPTQHLGAVANDMERKGKSSRIGDENRARQQRNAERAALAQDAAQITRDLAAEKARQDEQFNLRKTAQESYQTHEQIELGRKHSRQSARLDQEIEERNGERRRQFEADQQRLQEQLQADGWKKLMRDLLGKTRRDREELEITQKNLDSIRQREAEQRQALQLRQQEELQAQARAHEQQRNDYTQRLEQERQAALQKAAQPAQQSPRPEPANDRIKPVWERQATPEQDNTPPNQQEFRKAVGEPTPAPVPSRNAPDPTVEDLFDNIHSDRQPGRDRDFDV